MRRLRLFAALSVLTSAAFFPVLFPTPAYAAEGLTAQVYNVLGQNGSPYIPQGDTATVTTNVPNIDFQWGSGSVLGGPSEDVIVRFTGSIRSNTTQDISFLAEADDGTRLYIDGVLITDDWVDKGGGGTISTPVSFTAGIPKTIELMYYENGGGAWVQLSWDQSGSMQVIPAEAFTSQAAPVVKTIGPPRNLTITSSDTSTVLTWEAPDTGNTQPERYAISFSADGGGWGIATGNVGDANALNTTITIDHSLLDGLRPAGTVWSFHVRSDNDTLALYSENSNVVTGVTYVAPAPTPEPSTSPVPSPEPSPTQTPEAPTPSPSPTNTSPSPEPSTTPSPEPSVTPSPEPSVPPAPTPQPSPEPSPEPTPVPSPTPTPSPTPVEPTPVSSPEPQPVPSPEPGPVPSVEPTPQPVPVEPALPVVPQPEPSNPTPEPEPTPVSPEPTPTDPPIEEPEPPIEPLPPAVEPEEPPVEPEEPEEPSTPVEPEPTPPTLEPEPENPLEEPSQPPVEEPAPEPTPEPEPEPITEAEEVATAVEDVLSDGKLSAADSEAVMEALNADGEVTAEEVSALSEALSEDGKLTTAEKELVAEALIESVAPGETLTKEQIQDAGIEYKDLPEETPVEVRQDEEGNEVIITADVAAALVLLENPSELVGAIFSDPGEALQALGSIGADMSTEEREESTKAVVATVVAAGAAINAVGAAAGAASGSTGGSTGGGGASGQSGYRRRP